MNIEEKVYEHIHTHVENAGCIVKKVKWLKESGNQFLRIFITKDGLIDIDDCVRVTKIINPLIDELDVIGTNNYFLDVCSYRKEDE